MGPDICSLVVTGAEAFQKMMIFGMVCPVAIFDVLVVDEPLMRVVLLYNHWLVVVDFLVIVVGLLCDGTLGFKLVCWLQLPQSFVVGFLNLCDIHSGIYIQRFVDHLFILDTLSILKHCLLVRFNPKMRVFVSRAVHRI